MTNRPPPLWPHQQAAEDFVNSRLEETGVDAALLAMVMRSGKSRVTVDLLDQREARNTFIVAPKNAVDNQVWTDNFQKYSDRNVETLELLKGTIQQRLEKAKQFISAPTGRPKALITNLDVLSCSKSTAGGKAFLRWLIDQTWDAFVVDESHNYKAPGGVGSRAAAFLAHGGGVARQNKIPFRLGLTGTPVPKDPLDIYAQGRILNPQVWGTSYGYLKHRYAVLTANNGPNFVIGWRVVPGDRYFDHALYDEYQEKFHTLAFPVGSDVLNLPEPMHLPMYCDMTPHGRRVYKDIADEFYAEVEKGEITAANALVRATRLLQATSGFGKIADTDEEVPIDSAKESLLEDLLSGLDEPAVIFGRFHWDLDVIHRVSVKLEKSSLELSGRRNELTAWQNGGAQVLAVQPQAGGEAVDMTRAKVGIYYSLGPIYAKYYQSLSRLQAKDLGYAPVYYYLLTRNTVDDKVYRAYRNGHEANEEILRR